ncbi:MAG: hypothetical protein N3A01_06705 [Bacteroidales bacterium]|nr:hypothetical protein [Bacteroidales bacterium]
MNLLYIDPGNGSLLFQLIVAAMVTIVVFFKRIWRFIAFWKKDKNNDRRSLY